jgi:hypothetical protein
MLSFCDESFELSLELLPSKELSDRANRDRSFVCPLRYANEQVEAAFLNLLFVPANLFTQIIDVIKKRKGLRRRETSGIQSLRGFYLLFYLFL